MTLIFDETPFKKDSTTKYFLNLLYYKQDNRIYNCYEVLNSNNFPIMRYDPSNLQWISIMKSRQLILSDTSCNATSYKQCTNCQFYPSYCGTAIVYLRVFLHRKKGFALKIGVSNTLLRPLAQASPFAVVTDPIPRKDALFLERFLSNRFDFIYQSPIGRDSWAFIVKKGLWDGKSESSFLMNKIYEIYDSLDANIRQLLVNPTLYLPTKNFATDLPQWIELLPIIELKRIFTREPPIIQGEVIANRGFILLLEYGSSFYVFEPNERRRYVVAKIDGFGCIKPHFKSIKLRIKS